MKRIFLNFSVVALTGFALVLSSCTQTAQTEDAEEVTEEPAATEEEEEPAVVASPRAEVAADDNGVEVTINWGSPAVKGRTIWGDLEPYGTVWRAGANETTNIEFSADMMIGDTKVPAGKYGLFILPRETGDWTVIINTDWSRDEHGIWGAMGYSEEKDVARVDVTPEWSEEVQERLEYNVADGAIQFAWEKVRLNVPYSPAN